jgi:hypothetical protein
MTQGMWLDEAGGTQTLKHRGVMAQTGAGVESVPTTLAERRVRGSQGRTGASAAVSRSGAIRERAEGAPVGLENRMRTLQPNLQPNWVASAGTRRETDHVASEKLK